MTIPEANRLTSVGFFCKGERNHSLGKKNEIALLAKDLNITTILPMEWQDDLGLHLVARHIE